MWCVEDAEVVVVRLVCIIAETAVWILCVRTKSCSATPVAILHTIMWADGMQDGHRRGAA